MDSPSSSEEGNNNNSSNNTSPSKKPQPTISNFPRPSIAATATTARTSMSTNLTTDQNDHHLLGGGGGDSNTYYSSWEQSDIRSDLAAGWGGEDHSEIPMAGSIDERERNSFGSRLSAAASIDNENNNMDAEDTNNNNENEWGWRLNKHAVQSVPSFYPMDARSTRRITLSTQEELNNNTKQPSSSPSAVKLGEQNTQLLGGEPTTQTIDEITNRISTACQLLSIHGIWDNMCPVATLCSMERVEMEINLYLDTPAVAAASDTDQPQVILIEVQRRKGCSITFHNYRRCLLDAAEGKFNPNSFNQTDGLDKPLGRDRCNQPRASLDRPPVLSAASRPSSTSRPSSIMRPSLAKPSTTIPNLIEGDGGGSGSPSHHLRSPSFSADDAAMPIAGLKTEGDVPASPAEKAKQYADIFEKSMKALTIAATLIRKDRVDARRLGMESLVLLTDPMRAGMETAKIASRVVLLGSAHDESTADIGGGDMMLESSTSAEDDVDALFDESSGLGIRETILEMIMSEGEDEGSIASESESREGFAGIEKEFTDSLFNLCLTVLSNALNTIEESSRKPPPISPGLPPSSGGQDSDDSSSSDDSDGKPSPQRRRAATEPAVRPSGISRQFIDDTNSTFGCDVLSSLIRILGQAKINPHDAYHSARCLGVLFKGCGNSHKARAKRDLDAKRIIAAALEVGTRTHAKLADASRVAMVALVTDDEESMEEEETKTEMEEGEGEQQQQLPSVLEQSQSTESEER